MFICMNCSFNSGLVKRHGARRWLGGMMYALATGLPLIFIAFFGQMIKVARGQWEAGGSGWKAPEGFAS